MSESALSGYKKGQEIARVTAIILVFVGIMEISIGSLSHSISVTADGIDSLSDAVISLMVWFGLRVSLREPSRSFHYGYYKVESLVAFITSIAMIVIASFIVFRAYSVLFTQHAIMFPIYAIIAVAIAGSVSLYFAVRMLRIAKKHGLVSLQVGSANAIKDASASFIVLASVVLAAFGINWMDSVGAIIVSIYIYSVAYVAARESSLVLLDSFNSPEVVERVRTIVKSVPEVKDVSEIKLRRTGPFLSGRVKIEVEPTLSVVDANKIAVNVEYTLTKEIGRLREFVVLISPH